MDEDPNPSKYCPNCFVSIDRELNTCPQCQYDQPSSYNPQYLKPQVKLYKQYLIGRLLGEGGFGLTYLAYDLNLKNRVAIKEYFPRHISSRETQKSTIQPHSGKSQELFAYGKERFMEEARLLTQFRHPNIIRVQNLFEAAGTAYYVMEYLEGETLNAYMARAGRLNFAKVKALFIPLLDALGEIHSKDCYHRDIKPENIYLTTDKQPVLLDFGAARQQIAGQSLNMSVVLTPGFAPAEQYATKGKQGPWTDIYGLAATGYCLLTGEVPPPAPDRLMGDDELGSPRSLGADMTPTEESWLLKGLALRSADRPQSVAEWREMLNQVNPPQNRDSAGIEVDGFFINGGIPACKQVPAENKSSEKVPPSIVIASIKLSNRIENNLGMKFVLVQPGRFVMGSPATEKDRSGDETQHEVTLTKPYYLQTTEVTQGQWEAVMGNNPSYSKWDKNQPVEQVSWYDCQKFIHKLNAKGDGSTTLTNQGGYRLPTEAEWEYAARAGTTTAYACGDSASCLGTMAWFDSNSVSKTHPVGEKKPNAWGLYDMHGNVWEWVQDWYGSDYPSGAVTDPMGPSTGSYRVFRGGGWSLHACYCRSASRNYVESTARSFHLGFRLARSAP